MLRRVLWRKSYPRSSLSLVARNSEIRHDGTQGWDSTRGFRGWVRFVGRPFKGFFRGAESLQKLSMIGERDYMITSLASKRVIRVFVFFPKLP